MSIACTGQTCKIRSQHGKEPQENGLHDTRSHRGGVVIFSVSCFLDGMVRCQAIAWECCSQSPYFTESKASPIPTKPRQSQPNQQNQINPSSPTFGPHPDRNTQTARAPPTPLWASPQRVDSLIGCSVAFGKDKSCKNSGPKIRLKEVPWHPAVGEAKCKQY